MLIYREHYTRRRLVRLRGLLATRRHSQPRTPFRLTQHLKGGYHSGPQRCPDQSRVIACLHRAIQHQGSDLGREVGIILPNNQRQHRTLHIQKDELPYALCYLLCPVSAALAHIFRLDSISTSCQASIQGSEVQGSGFRPEASLVSLGSQIEGYLEKKNANSRGARPVYSFR